jgi:histidine ammonia-lyase
VAGRDVTIEEVMRVLRSCSPAMMQDRSLARDIEAVHHLVESGDIGHVARAGVAPLQSLRLD